jgi:LysR family transcriptional activator of nhaA
VRTLRRGLPRSLDGAPVFLPGGRAALRRSLEPWFDAKGLRPRVVGEFEDSALLKAFGQGGHGAFAGPTLIAAEIERQYRAAEGGPVPSGPRRSRARRLCALRLSGARRR